MSPGPPVFVAGSRTALQGPFLDIRIRRVRRIAVQRRYCSV